MNRSIVRCYAGGRYPERPRAFLWAGTWLEVEAVESEWRTPTTLTFRVRATAARFDLSYTIPTATWAVEPTRKE